MFQRQWSWMVVVLASLLLAASCAREATEKVAEAGRDLEDAWIAEKNAAVGVMKDSVDATARQIEQMRAKAAELEQAAATDVADLEAKQKKAVAELRKVEAAEAGAWAEMRHGFVAAYHDLADAGKRARQRLAAA